MLGERLLTRPVTTAYSAARRRRIFQNSRVLVDRRISCMYRHEVASPGKYSGRNGTSTNGELGTLSVVAQRAAIIIGQTAIRWPII